MRVTVRPQGSITLYGRRELPLMEVRIVASATVEQREDTSMVRCRRGSDLESCHRRNGLVARHSFPSRRSASCFRARTCLCHKCVPLALVCDITCGYNESFSKHARLLVTLRFYTASLRPPLRRSTLSRLSASASLGWTSGTSSPKTAFFPTCSRSEGARGATKTFPQTSAGLEPRLVGAFRVTGSSLLVSVRTGIAARCVVIGGPSNLPSVPARRSTCAEMQPASEDSYRPAPLQPVLLKTRFLLTWQTVFANFVLNQLGLADMYRTTRLATHSGATEFL